MYKEQCAKIIRLVWKYQDNYMKYKRIGTEILLLKPGALRVICFLR